MLTSRSRSRSSLVRRGFVVAAALAAMGLALALIACESVANLDVVYHDAAAADAPGPEILHGCPCDPSLGDGCCVNGSNAPFCTGDTTQCAAAGGMHLKCAAYDPLTESLCCWHGRGAGAVTAFAAYCDAGPVVCTKDEECGFGNHCSTTTCGAVTIGACGDVAPLCP